MLEQMNAKQPTLRHMSFRNVLVPRLRPFLLNTFVAITVLAVFVPFNPEMPDKGVDPAWISAIRQARGKPQEVWSRSLAKLDQSWTFSLNAAVAQRLRFGKEIIFTFGPYASIYTRSFHPGTDRLMIFGSLLLGLGYGIALVCLSRGRKPYTIVILLLFCATFSPSDALFLSYPFLLAACAVKVTESHNSKERVSLNWWQLFAAGVTLSALGLLPLIKGSLLAPAGLSMAVVSIFLLYGFPLRQAIPLLVVPAFASITLWVVAHQSLSDFPAFLRGTIWLTSGYTEAMSTPWLSWPTIVGYGFVIAYLGVSALICLSLVRSTRFPVRSKWLLSFLYAALVLVAFKHGFVRTDHVAIAFHSLVLFALIIVFLYTDRYLVSAVTIAIVLVVGISFRQDPELIKEVRDSFGIGTATGRTQLSELVSFVSKRAIAGFARVTYKSTFRTYTQAWQGVRIRLRDDDALLDRFEKAKANIRAEYAVPVLNGGVDIYFYEQALVLVSDNEWNPRPVFQSYSAYTPGMAKLNEEHLRSKESPNWVLIDLQNIDGRLPSLDDGMSWLALLDNYRVSSFDGQFLTLRKNQSLEAKSNLDVIYEQEQRIGVTVALPEANGPLYAEVKLRPTLLGRLLITLFKPPQLNMALTLRNGKTETYRVISNMMETGFVVSPLVCNTADFASLAVGDRRFQDEAKVVSMSIAPSYGGSIFWASKYTLTIKAYGSPVARTT